MQTVVMKFGGTSMGSVERIGQAARKVAMQVRSGTCVAVVVSAMAGETDRLAALPGKVSPGHDLREYDTILAAGEQVSAALMAISLQKLGIPARSWMAWQIPIKSNNMHGFARIDEIQTENIKQRLREKEVAVVAGFQGVSPRNRISTLGRGGSDISAVALAAALNAQRCDIFTDVEGVYTCDPRIVPQARKLTRITYEEMLELASQGARVLQTRSVEIAMKHSICLHVRSTFSDNAGTKIVSEREKNMEKPLVSGIACNCNEAKLTLVAVPDKPGIASAVFGALANAGINVDMIVQNISHHRAATDLTFTVAEPDLGPACAALAKLRENLPYQKLITNSVVAKISIIGVGMRSHPGVASRMFEALADKGINIQVISTSEIKIAVLIHRRHAQTAAEALHSAFELAQPTSPSETTTHA